MKTTGRVNGIISNIVIVKADGPVGQNEICHVYCGDTKMMAEVIKVVGDNAYVQVFDSTRGLKIGEKVNSRVTCWKRRSLPVFFRATTTVCRTTWRRWTVCSSRAVRSPTYRLREEVGVQAAGQAPATRFRPRHGWGRSRRSGSSTRSWYPHDGGTYTVKSVVPAGEYKVTDTIAVITDATAGITILRWCSGGL